MIKALILDADGLVIKNHEYFSIRYKRDFGKTLNEDVVSNFFRNEFKLASTGKADLKDLLKNRLKDWSWEGSLDELLEYWFSGERELDDKVLKLIESVRKKGVKLGLASDNEKYRAEYLDKIVGLNSKFDEVFYSCSLQHSKSEVEFFIKVVQELNLKPQEILYFDDDIKNVEVAKSIGISAFLYEGFDNFVGTLKELDVKI